jgi:hypothetical protein
MRFEFDEKKNRSLLHMQAAAPAVATASLMASRWSIMALAWAETL